MCVWVAYEQSVVYMCYVYCVRPRHILCLHYMPLLRRVMVTVYCYWLIRQVMILRFPIQRLTKNTRMLRRLPFYVEYVFTKYLKTQILKTLVHGTFLVENVFFAFLLRYDDPNQLLYLGYDYVRSNVVIYTDNMTLSVPCCVVCVIIIVSLSSPQV